MGDFGGGGAGRNPVDKAPPATKKDTFVSSGGGGGNAVPIVTKAPETQVQQIQQQTKKVQEKTAAQKTGEYAQRIRQQVAAANLAGINLDTDLKRRNFFNLSEEERQRIIDLNPGVTELKGITAKSIQKGTDNIPTSNSINLPRENFTRAEQIAQLKLRANVKAAELKNKILGTVSDLSKAEQDLTDSIVRRGQKEVLPSDRLKDVGFGKRDVNVISDPNTGDIMSITFGTTAKSVSSQGTGGRGTVVTQDPRQLTFEESYNIQADKYSKRLQEAIKQNYIDAYNGKIDEKQFQENTQKALHDYNNSEKLKNIPKNVAIGAGLVFASRVPVVGRVIANVAKAAFVLNSASLAQEFKDYPLATALEQGAFLAGGVGASKILSIREGLLTKQPLKINEADITQKIRGVTKYVGEEKQQAVSKVVGGPAESRVALSREQIDRAIVYDLKLNDGRIVRIISVDKQQSKFPGGKNIGETIQYAYELIPKGSELITNRRALSRAIQTDDGKYYVQSYILKNPSTPTRKFFQRLGILKPNLTEVKSIGKQLITGRKQFGKGDIIGFREETKNIGSKRITNRAFIREVKDIINKYDRGDKITVAEARKLFNFERLSQNKELFTDKQFEKAGPITLTKGYIGRLRNKAKLTIVPVKPLLKLRVTKSIGGVSIIEAERAATTKRKLPESKLKSSEGITIKQLEKNIIANNKGEVKRNRVPSIKTNIGKGITLLELKKNIEAQRKIPKVKLSSISKGAAPTLIIPEKTSTSKAFTKVRAFGKVALESKASFKETKFGNRDKSTQVNLKSTRQLEPINEQVRVDSKPNVRSATSTFVSSSSRENLKTGELNIPKERQFEEQLPAVRQSFRLRQEIRQRQRVRFATDFSSKFDSRSKIKPPNPPVPILTTGGGGFDRLKAKVTRKPFAKFDVFVKDRGTLRRINPTPLSKKGAFGLGAKRTDTTLKASFLVKKSSRPGFTRNLALERLGNKVSYKFAPSKRTPGVFVERPRFRIEKKGTTLESSQIQSFRRNTLFRRRNGKAFISKR